MTTPPPPPPNVNASVLALAGQLGDLGMGDVVGGDVTKNYHGVPAERVTDIFAAAERRQTRTDDRLEKITDALGRLTTVLVVEVFALSLVLFAAIGGLLLLAFVRPQVLAALFGGWL